MSEIDLSKLAEPFPAEDVEWRIGRAGSKNGKLWARCFAYIDNRAIQERLDAVCGLGGWQNHILKVDGGCLCGISIKVGGEWVTKWDGSDNTDFEAFKGGISGAMKRAASQWGIGRYLYNLEEGFADISDNGKLYQAASKGGNGKEPHDAFRWNPPHLPDWALPKTPARADGRFIPKTPDDRKPTFSKEYADWAKSMQAAIVGKVPGYDSFENVKQYLSMTPAFRGRFKTWPDVLGCTEQAVFQEFANILGDVANKQPVAA